MPWWCSILAVLLALTGCGREEAYHAQLGMLPDFGVAHLQADSLAVLLKGEEQPFLLDTRTPQEWAVSRLPAARVVDVQAFEVAQLDSLPRDTPIVLYCSVGYRSGEVGKKLQEAGFLQVYNLYGGILEWKNSGYPLLTPAGDTTEQVHTYSSYWATFLEEGEAVY